MRFHFNTDLQFRENSFLLEYLFFYFENNFLAQASENCTKAYLALAFHSEWIKNFFHTTVFCAS